MADCTSTFKQRTSPAQRRNILRQVIALAVYLAAILVTTKFVHPAHMALTLICALTSIFLLTVMVIMGLYLKEEKDEFLRVILQRGLLWGMGATLAFISIWGCLEMFLHVRHFPLFYVFDIFCLFTAIITTSLRVYYRIQS